MTKTRSVLPKLIVTAFFVLLLLPVSGLAQADVARGNVETNAAPASKAPEKKPDSEVAHKLESLEEQLRAQSGRIDQLTALIAEQQRLINQLLATQGSNNATAKDPAPVTVSSISEAPGTAPAAATNQNPDDRIKKLEDRVTRIGPFRFSGDFRLRFDGTFRTAEPNPPAGFAPLTHVQNARMRYRFRFNFDTDLNDKLSFHGQLSTGNLADPLSADTDFAHSGVRALISLSEIWMDYHPNKAFRVQAGRVQEIFNDNSRFMFDDDVRLNGLNEYYTFTFDNNGLKVSSVELRAGQYFLTNPNVAIVTPGSPLAATGAVIGSTGRAAQLFHQGLLVNQKFNDRWSSQFGGDVQLYRNQNQIQLASTVAGVPLIIQNGMGIVLSGPIGGVGTATTTPGGAIYTAPRFQIARATYRLNWAGFKAGGREYPVVINLQGARNIGTGLPERDAMLAALQVGRTVKRGDMAFHYVFGIKGANAMISQFTDNDFGTGSGVNIRVHHLRFDYAISPKVTWQSLLYIQNELRNSGQYPNFFVPLNAFTPRQYRIQEQLVFRF
jgi:putative porin